MNNEGTNLRTPVEVAIGTIEKELASLWESAAAAERPVMRACSCNLIAILEDDRKAEQFPAILARVSEWHPSRSLIAYVEPDTVPAAPAMRAWISAECYLPPSGGPEVCCEAITIAAAAHARMDLPHTLLALLVPDLPVYLYWRSFRKRDRALVERMARFSRLLIVDSHQSSEDPENRLSTLEMLSECPLGVAVRDLNWARITAWRDLIAQFFDSEETRPYVHRISSIEIERNLSASGSIPTRTLLLTGWLASSLGWKLIAAKRSGDQWFSRWASSSGEVRVCFTGTYADGREPGISSVVLHAGSEATFSVAVEAGCHCLNSVASVKGGSVEHSVPLEVTDEASLLIHELSQTGEDVVFKKALATAFALERSFLFPDKNDSQGVR